VNVSTLIENSLWAALFATVVGILMTVPTRYLSATFLCGFFARFIRDVLMGWGMSQNWSTVIAAAALVLVAVAIVRRHQVPPAVLIGAVLPLSASVAIFNTIIGLMRVSSAQGDALEAATVALSANAGKAFIGTLALALGLGAGMTVARLLQGERSEEV
jgi:uncharacterized membrane protein YjjB (DUF3815 family)